MIKEVLGNGVYTYAEAARLLGLPSAKISAWFRGWPRGRDPLFARDYASLHSHKPVISFLNLVDAHVAASLRLPRPPIRPKDPPGKPLSVHTIRELHARLSAEWRTEHPFSRRELRNLYADQAGKQIFVELLEEEGQSAFVEVFKNQRAMPEVLLPFLKPIVYDTKTRLARHLTLMDGVILDPRRRYGKPIVVPSRLACRPRPAVAVGRRGESHRGRLG